MIEDYVLGPLPEHQLPELAQVLAPAHDGQEVVACQLPDDAGEPRTAVGEEDLRLAVAAGVEEYFAGSGEAGVVLEADADVEVAQRDPGRLPAPTDVDDLVLEGQKPAEGLAGLGSALLLESGGELERTSRDTQLTHRQSLLLMVWTYRTPVVRPALSATPVRTVRPGGD